VLSKNTGLNESINDIVNISPGDYSHKKEVSITAFLSSNQTGGLLRPFRSASGFKASFRLLAGFWSVLPDNPASARTQKVASATKNKDNNLYVVPFV